MAKPDKEKSSSPTRRPLSKETRPQSARPAGDAAEAYVAAPPARVVDRPLVDLLIVRLVAQLEADDLPHQIQSWRATGGGPRRSNPTTRD